MNETLGIELTGLFDEARIVRELRVGRKVAAAMMRALPKQTVPGVRKTYVRAGDLQRWLDENRVRP